MSCLCREEVFRVTFAEQEKGTEVKIKVADFVAQFLAAHQITDVFSVTGGGAMYLNNALGRHPKLHVTYNHHEQASAMAAEAYARVNNELAVVCVTTGPGATNAVTGVAGGWVDSIPMLILSGQARYETTVRGSGLQLRTRGVQEVDILRVVQAITKYCEMVDKPEKILFCLQKALFLAKEGRPGPCWLDVPLDVQSAVIETDDLEQFSADGNGHDIDDETVCRILDRLAAARRPLLFAGNGIRLSGAHSAFLEMVEVLDIPVVTGMSSIDAIDTDSPHFAGRSGTTGERAGNFAVQNCDVLLSIGSRQSFMQTGFTHERWAQNAYKILNDIDPEELKKDSLHADMPVPGDAAILIRKLTELARKRPLPKYTSWLQQCAAWREKYPVVQQKHYRDGKVNIYAFFREMTAMLSADRDIVVSAGTSRVVGSQASIIKRGQRFFTNPTLASMGFDLPAAIGVCVAEKKKPLVLVTGDGSLQMNLQELQTIVHHQLPILIFVMNNQGYHSIRMTQRRYFDDSLVGVGPDSGDISFPDLSKLIPAYGIRYESIGTNAELKERLEQVLQLQGPCVCEVMLTTEQITEPKLASRTTEDGRIVSGTLEDMAPFLSREELAENMLGQ